MSTPAQLLALKQAQDVAANVTSTESSPSSSAPAEQSLAPSDDVPSSVDSSSSVNSFSTAATSQQSNESKAPIKSSKKHYYAMNDDKAFPSLTASLGIASTADSSTSVPAANTGVTGWAQAAASAVPQGFRPAVRSSSTQLTFIVNADQQAELSKADIFKIFSRIQRAYGVKVESTLSTATNKRTFLLTGPASTIQAAKRDVLKRLTKPVKITFQVPSSLRPVIIGSQGRTLKPILQDTKTRIDIEHDSRKEEDEEAKEPVKDDDDDDNFLGKMLNVTVEGDIAACQEAKARIMSIVDENTKNLDIKLPIDPSIKRFAPKQVSELNLPEDLEVTFPTAEVNASNILISGARDEVLEARTRIKDLLATLASKIVTEDENVPKRVHPLLDADKIFEATNVLVNVPSQDSDIQTVSFIGVKDQIPVAVAFAKQLCADFYVDSLDLARSHGGDAPHAKCLTAYFLYTKYFDQLSTKYDVMIHAPSYASLADDKVKTAVVTFTCHKDKRDILKTVRKEVVDSVNKITPNLVRVITDIDSFVFNKIDSTVATENGVSIVPLGSLAGFGNKLILILQQNDDEFLPSGKEIQEKLDTVDSSLESLRDLSKTVISKVIPVNTKDQDHLQGKTLSVLLGKFETGSVEIKLHQNEEGPSENEIFLRGYKSVIDSAITDIDQTIDDVKNYEEACKYNVTVEFPSKLLSRLIGRNGKHLDQLRKEFDVNVDVLDDNKDKESSDESSVKITGLKSNADECVKRLVQLNKRWSDEKTVIMKIDPKYHRRLIGPSGIYVNKIQDRYKVVVRFPHDTDKAHNDEVVIRGPSRGVTKAEEELKELLEYERENGYTETICVPNDVLSRVIGKKGEEIKDISARAEVSLNRKKVPEEEQKKQGYAEFEIVGSHAGIKKAKGYIKSIIDRVENQETVTLNIDPKYHRYLIGPGGSTKRQIILKAGGSDENVYEFRKYLQVPNKGSDSDEIICTGDKRVIDKIVKEVNRIVSEQERITSETVQVPKKKHRLLIGAGGSVRRSLEDEFKVRLNIPRVNVESDEVTIRGLPENIAKAKAKIETIVA